MNLCGACALTVHAHVLPQVCKNPRNPGFNHYLFESVAALIKFVGSSNPAMIDTFEQLLFPAFNHVLQQVSSRCQSAVNQTAVKTDYLRENQGLPSVCALVDEC